MADPTVAELLELCTSIQSHASRIPVRVNFRGQWEHLTLAEMPAELAVWWAMEFVIRRLTGRRSEEGPPNGIAD